MIGPVAYGTTLWFVAATFINKADALFQPTTSTSVTLMLYGAAIPIAYTSVKIMPSLSICKKSEIMRSTAIGLAAATLLDGLALVFVPSLYGNTTNSPRGAAWLLWGVGWFLIFGIEK